MFGTMDLQIQYLLLLQEFRHITNGLFDNVFITATWFGELIIPVAFMAMIYWSFNKKAGTYLFFTFGLTLYVNVFLKMTACIKRPWLIDSRVQPIEQVMPAADGYSFPSGHTAGAMAVWGGSAYFWRRNKAVLITGMLLVLLVGFSRNYVGVHTPQDVIISILAGIFILISADRLLNWIDKKPNRDILFYAVIMVITAILYLYIHIKCCIQMQTYNCLTDNINPLEMKHTVYSKFGFMVGIFTGWILEKRFIKYTIPAMPVLKKILLSIAGLILLSLIIFLADKILFILPAKHITSAVKIFLIPFFITFIYPATLKKLLNIG